MDVRLFKLIAMIGIEAVLLPIYLLEPRFQSMIPFYHTIREAHRLFMLSVPILIWLPEDNWIWIVEENPRGRKISLRSKASKHLHLSMLYIFAISFPSFIFCLAIIILPVSYSHGLTNVFIITAAVYGIYCAWQNHINVMKHESLFAVAWDRKAAFFEIFVGFSVARKPVFFFSGTAVIFGIALIISSIIAPIIYFSEYPHPFVIFDIQKYVTLSALFNFFLVLGVWGTSMYVSFQLFFSRRVEKWSRQPREKKRV